MEIEPLRIVAANPGPLTGDGNNTWLLDGDEPTLVDAGLGSPAHLDAIAGVLGGRPLVRVLVTHGHSDHASGVTALRARWPSIDARKWLSPNDRAEVWRPLADGDRVRAGDRELAVVHTPGHAPDHVCFWDQGPRALYAGDMLIRGTSVVIPAGRGGNLRDYLASLDRLAALEPKRAYPGHGEVIEQPQELIANYLAHRKRRDGQVLESVAAGATTADAIVDRIYPGLAESLRPAARLTIEAHLEKLRGDGRLP